VDIEQARLLIIFDTNRIDIPVDKIWETSEQIREVSELWAIAYVQSMVKLMSRSKTRTFACLPANPVSTRFICRGTFHRIAKAPTASTLEADSCSKRSPFPQDRIKVISA
jgi:hypothetical protein